VRMLKSCGQANLAEKTVGTESRCQLRMKDFQRDRPIVPKIAGK